MQARGDHGVRAAIEQIYRDESGRIRATLIRMLGDFDLAEDAMQEAFSIALNRWVVEGIPENARPWLISTARFKAIDTLRRRKKMEALGDREALMADLRAAEFAMDDDAGLEDDRLRLIFTCCHPALPPEARLALTLREVCGLTTEEIARAFLTTPSTLAQRIVRAKARIRELRLPYQVPAQADLPDRLAAVLHVVYLVFNEGYSASSGESLTRTDLTHEAIRLGRILADLLPEPEVLGLLALMLLQESRRVARTTAGGDLVLLEDQDRTLWDRDQIREGIGLVERALVSRRFGRYTLQAAIAAVHAEAETAAQTDWRQIVVLYGALMELDPSPVVALNRAVAIAMRSGPAEGLALIDTLLNRGDLVAYSFAHSARAELCRQLGRIADAQTSYQRALDLTRQEPDRRWLRRRLDQLSKKT